MHATGRRGLMRDVALAGTDVRSIVHHAAASALTSGVMQPLPLTLLALACAGLLAVGGRAASALVLLCMVAGLACAIAYLRTAWLTATGDHRARLGRLAAAGISVALDLTASGMLAFAPGGGLARIALGLAAVAPLVALYFLAAFVLERRATPVLPVLEPA